MADSESGRFDVLKVAGSFPDTATTMLLDQYLTRDPASSARVFRVYRGTPPHYHANCDEYLYVLSGAGSFWIGNVSAKADFGPGQLLFFKRGTVHSLPELFEHPVVFLSVDVPRRAPDDIVFVDPADGTAEGFIQER
jgi:mannose-6-phosphate isomerase-like protein (cupin superfamily)